MIVSQYKFGYSVADSTTGDSKTREEERDGDVVRGSYSVADPDGRIRTVTYTADALNGFQVGVLFSYYITVFFIIIANTSHAFFAI